MKYKESFDTFKKRLCATLDKRMEKGFHTYGDISFSCKPEELIAETIEELYDVLGWSCIMISKLESIKKRIEGIDDKKMG